MHALDTTTGQTRYRVTIATTVPPSYRVDFHDLNIGAPSAEEARRDGERGLGAWQHVCDVIAFHDIPARAEKERIADLEKSRSPAEVEKRQIAGDLLERQRAGSRAANARRREARI